MKWVRFLLYAGLLLLLLLLAGSLHPIYAEDSRIWIYNSELTQLLTLTKDLKTQLEVCRTNSLELTIQLESLNGSMKSSGSNYLALLKQVTLSTNQLRILSEAQTDLTNSWELYKTGAEQTIKKLESEKLLWMGIGIAGVLGGIAIAIIF